MSLPIRFNTVLQIATPPSESFGGEGKKFVIVMAREYHREKSSQSCKLIATAYDPRSATDYLLSVEDMSDDENDDDIDDHINGNNNNGGSSSSSIYATNSQSNLSMLSNGSNGMLNKKRPKSWGVEVSDETSPEDLAKDLEKFHARGKV